jgi:hypothetical protein
MSYFCPMNRKTAYLLAPSMEEWLPEDYLARFIMKVMEDLDISRLERADTGRGSAAYYPRHSGYRCWSMGTRRASSSVAKSSGWPTARCLSLHCGRGNHPDLDTLVTFRRRCLDELSDLFRKDWN